MNGSLQLSEYPTEMVRLACAKCGRVGQYRKQNLIEKYGANIRLLGAPCRSGPSKPWIKGEKSGRTRRDTGYRRDILTSARAELFCVFFQQQSEQVTCWQRWPMI
jgi:hypothetical protein